ncbi:MAG: glycosyltransferase family 39 protein [Butyrivibrio sp.]|nr:glycosyltransferase family 39 protein [Butyrivibrio sp.]
MIEKINILFILINIAIIVYTFYISYHKANSVNTSKINPLIIIPVIITGAIIRLIYLDAIPYGLQQDEASIGYEAFSLLTYGVDRNLYPYPVYPITWGSGGGSPIMIYLTMLSSSIFGTNVFSLRIVPAFLGVITLIIFYLILKELHNTEEIAIAGTAFLSICPWHVILSRWSLDSNTVPFWVSLAILFFIKATKSQKTSFYILAAAGLSLCLYSYGSSTIVIPLTILFACTYALYKGNLSIKQLLFSFISFLIVAIPIGYFYMVNYIGLPEIKTALVTINKFTCNRIGSVFLSGSDTPLQSLIENIKGLFLSLTIGNDAKEMTCNYYPGFATLLEYTFPITFLGIGVMFKNFFKSLKKNEDYYHGSIWLFMLIASLILNLLINQDINRMVFMYLPLVYAFTVGLESILRASFKVFALAGIMSVAGCMLFLFCYFTDYNNSCGSIFMPGYGEACTYADTLIKDNGSEGTVYSSYTDVAAPYMLALYYTKTSPFEFYDTVVYKDPEAEFRIASSFGHFIFELPEDAAVNNYSGDVFIIAAGEKYIFDGTDYEMTDFGKYTVVVPN